MGEYIVYTYKIGYGSPEYHELAHELQFTEDDLTEMISEAVVSIVSSIKNPIDMPHSFSCIIQNVIAWLCEYKNFKRITYEVTWSCYGWSGLFDSADRSIGRDYDSNLGKITKALEDAGYTPLDDPFIKQSWIERSCVEMMVEELEMLYPELYSPGDDVYDMSLKISWDSVYGKDK